MKEAISLEQDGRHIQTFLTRADKLYSQAKFNQQAKFGVVRDALKSDEVLLKFVLFRGAKSYSEIDDACMEYAYKLKMQDGTVINKGKKGVRFTVQSEPKYTRIKDLCK